MSKNPAAPLSLPAIPKKGEAIPAVQSLETARPDPVVNPSFPPPTPLRPSSRVRATIAVTLRLDEERYERLKSYGAARRLTNQEILVAALDGFFVENC